MTTSVPQVSSHAGLAYDALPDETKFAIWAATHVNADDTIRVAGSIKYPLLAGASNRAIQRGATPIHPLSHDTVIVRAGWGLHLFDPATGAPRE